MDDSTVQKGSLTIKYAVLGIFSKLLDNQYRTGEGIINALAQGHCCSFTAHLYSVAK